MTAQEDVVEVMADEILYLQGYVPEVVARAALAALDRAGYAVVKKAAGIRLPDGSWASAVPLTAEQRKSLDAWLEEADKEAHARWKEDQVKKAAGIHHEREGYVGEDGD